MFLRWYCMLYFWDCVHYIVFWGRNIAYGIKFHAMLYVIIKISHITYHMWYAILLLLLHAMTCDRTIVIILDKFPSFNMLVQAYFNSIPQRRSRIRQASLLEGHCIKREWKSMISQVKFILSNRCQSVLEQSSWVIRCYQSSHSVLNWKL